MLRIQYMYNGSNRSTSACITKGWSACIGQYFTSWSPEKGKAKKNVNLLHVYKTTLWILQATRRQAYTLTNWYFYSRLLQKNFIPYVTKLNLVISFYNHESRVISQKYVITTISVSYTTNTLINNWSKQECTDTRTVPNMSLATAPVALFVQGGTHQQFAKWHATCRQRYP
jgi:hypothetical protein